MSDAPARFYGYRPDEPDHRDLRFKAFGAGPLVPVSHRVHRGPRLFQGRAGACGAFALTRALRMAHGRQAEGTGVPADVPMVSPRWLYYVARMREQAFMNVATRKLEDVGVQPRTLMLAAQKAGYPTWSQCPYVDYECNLAPGVGIDKWAVDQRGFTFRRIDDTGVDRARAISQAMAAGSEVIFGLLVDEALEAYKGGAPIASIDGSKVKGGHMVTVLDVDASTVGLDNWWVDFGGPEDDGTWRMTHELLGSNFISDVYAIEKAPYFLQEAA